jgi:hypothetical protein
MKTYTINNKKYNLSQDLIKKYPVVFKGCNNSKTFVEKRKIDKKNYISARPSKDSWKKSNGKSYRYDKIFFLKGFIEETYVNNKSSSDSDSSDSLEDVDEEKSSNKSLVHSKKLTSTESSSSSEEDAAPNIIELENDEKFVDDNGKIVDIEVRGERKYDEIYFRVKDISKGFELPNLDKTLMNKRGYEKLKHYICFCMVINDYHNGKNKNKNNNRNNNKKYLYLTYIGLIKVLFSSRKHIAESFVNWASKTLFIAHLGSPDQKIKLAGNLIGVSADVVKAVFSKTATEIPCIYLFSLGTVKSLRKKLHLSKEYEDTDFVYKFGMTIDLKRRTKEHVKEFGNDIEFVTFGLIDAQYISEAETDLKRNFKDLDYIITHEKYKEIVVIPSKKLLSVKKQFNMISRLYMGHISELVSEIKFIKETHAKEIALKDKEIALKDKEIALKDVELRNAEISLLKKDLEIANLKLKKR